MKLRRFSKVVSLIVSIGEASGYYPTAGGVSIAVVGDWNTTISATDLTHGIEGIPRAMRPASAFESSCRSAADQIRLEVSGARGRWKVFVRKGDANWPDDFVLKVEKSSGADRRIVTVSDADKEFFSGTGNGVHCIQIGLDGLSAAVAAGTYTTTLVFTITDGE